MVYNLGICIKKCRLSIFALKLGLEGHAEVQKGQKWTENAVKKHITLFSTYEI